MRRCVNFPSSVHLREPDEIYRATMEILAPRSDSNRLQLQISENPPPHRLRVSYPAIVRAINDFAGS